MRKLGVKGLDPLRKEQESPGLHCPGCDGCTPNGFLLCLPGQLSGVSFVGCVLLSDSVRACRWQPVLSPLEGTKMTVNNLHPRVTEEDIVVSTVMGT